MTYSDFTTDDFINDAQFRLWVQQPDEHTDTFWANFLIENPDKKVAVANAQSILKAIEQQVHTTFLSQEDEDQILITFKNKLRLKKHTEFAVYLFGLVGLLLLASLWDLCFGNLFQQKIIK